ncbi:MAG: ATP synthase F1 subunit gamma [Acholeplasmatales bacterium]|nr:ATP synthase F1 subunit gamma [Acholeplasmatales bacterium]
MANSLREVKIKINSTKSTAQITKAMHTVSKTKVKKAERTYKSYKDFMARIKDVVEDVVFKEEDVSHPLLEEREVLKTAYFIITSDRGLAGPYNASVEKALEQRIKECHKSNDEFITASVGKKGYYFLKKKGYTLLKDEPTYVRDDVLFVDIAPLAKAFVDLYLDKEIDKLVIVYNHYVNSITQEVLFEELLPIKKIEKNEKTTDFVFETGIEKTLDLILPMYVQDIVYGIILDAKTAEHSARMNAMKNATDNAEEIIAKLQLMYNRARQSVVTNELIDIVGGANQVGGDN